MPDRLLGCGVYSYRDKAAKRLRALCETLRRFGYGQYIPIVVAEDFDPRLQFRDDYVSACRDYGVTLRSLSAHSHMSGANHEAVLGCDAEWVLVCSDDVMVPRGLVTAIAKFLTDNHNRLSSGFGARIAAVYLHHWDRTDIIRMVADRTISELTEFTETSFYEENGRWFWHELDGRLPYPDWSEPTPEDQIGVCCTVHGSAYLVRRSTFLAVGGTANADVWQNDTLISARINNFTDGLIIRLPFLPSIAHAGGQADVPPDPSGKWARTVANLAHENGAAYGSLPDLMRPDGSAVSPIEMLEIGWRLRAYANQKRFESELASFDYGYKSECDP